MNDEKFKKCLEKIENHFENITEEQLNENLRKCGIDKVLEYIKEDKL